MPLAALIAVAVVIPLPPPPVPPPPVLPLPVPCVPVPIPGCGGPVDPPPPPPAGDLPPRFTAPLVVVARTSTTLAVTWKAAVDDRGVKLYVLQRDGRTVGARGPQARAHRFQLVCGQHTYRVVAIDLYAQRAPVAVLAHRQCKLGRR